MTASVLLIDNRDSFVWNLAQAFGLLGRTVDVVRSDAIDAQGVERRHPDAIVLSPGPGRPEAAGVCVDIAQQTRRPLLGVCLGHQAIGHAFGARVVRVPPCHGKAWSIVHDGGGLFDALPRPFRACRYHSLAVDGDSLPAEFVVDARTPEQVVMGVRHRTRPLFGVQFHPESFRSEHGLQLLQRFLEVAA